MYIVLSHCIFKRKRGQLYYPKQRRILSTCSSSHNKASDNSFTTALFALTNRLFIHANVLTIQYGDAIIWE